MLSRLKPGSLFGRILATHMGVIVITLLAVGLLFTHLVERYVFSAREWELASQSRQVVEVLSEEYQTHREGPNVAELNKIADTMARSLDVKIRLVDLDRQEVLVADPGTDTGVEVTLEPHELDRVLEGNTLTKKVYGPGMQRLLVARPILRDHEADPLREGQEPSGILGAVTVSAPLTGIHATVAQITQLTLYSGLVASVLAGLLALSLAKTVSRPVQAMTQAAREVVDGNYQSRIHLQPQGELGELVSTFNQAVDQMERTVAEQKRLQALQRNLVANVSHEFRVPLTSIRGFAEAMQQGFVSADEQQRALSVIIDNTRHLKRLVDDLLELSSLESGQVQLHMEVLDVNSLASLAAGNLQQRAVKQGVELHLRHASARLHMRGDKDRLFQVLTNLVENALDHTPAGGEVELKVSGQEKQIMMEVKDTGLGIPPEDLPHIWDRFYKVDKSRNRARGGQGLGLSIVRELVRLHRGEIYVESEPGQGSRFVVVLPRDQAPVPAPCTRE